VADLERISITIEPELLGRFDRWREACGGVSRSEALRDLMRARLSDEAVGLPESPAVGTLTLLFDHRQRELADRLTELGHEHHHIVLASMHQHLDHDHCLEVLTLRGPAGRLRTFASALGGLKGVLLAELVLAAAPPIQVG
jgi:CopG family nickel-responsive transcriptional regulator